MRGGKEREMRDERKGGRDGDGMGWDGLVTDTMRLGAWGSWDGVLGVGGLEGGC